MGGRGGSGGGKGGAGKGGGGGGATGGGSEPRLIPGQTSDADARAAAQRLSLGQSGEFMLNGRLHTIGSKLDESLAQFAKERRDAANARRRAARAAKAKGQ